MVAVECQTRCPLMQASQTSEITVILNGEERRVPSGCSVASLLDALGIQRERVAVELNRRIIRQPDWESTAVEQGAQLEVVQFVGGG